MRVLLGTTLYQPGAGGKENYLAELAGGLARRGHEVRCLARFDEWEVFARRRLDFRRAILTGRDAIVQPLDVAGPCRVLHALLGPLVVRPALSDLARGIAQRSYAMRVLDLVRRADVVHYDGTGFELVGWALLAAARRAGKPFIVVPHLHAGKWGDGPLDLALYRRASAVVAKTPVEAACLAGGGVDLARIRVIGNAAGDPPPADPAAFRTRIGAWGPLVLFLARKDREKGFDLFCGAAAAVREALPGAVLVAAGRGNGGDLAREAGVLELGWLDEEDKASALSACDVLCVPSRGEAFGIVYLEAWARGKPVVAGKTDQISAVVEDGVDGILAGESAGEVARALISLLSHPERAGAMGARGRKKFRETCRWDRVVDETIALYLECVEGVEETR